MSVHTLAPAAVEDLTRRISLARNAADAAGEAPPPGGAEEAAYWEHVFEHHARRVLAAVPEVRLHGDRELRYRYFGSRGTDLLVRPFVLSRGVDPAPVRRLLAWHPPPDSMSPGERLRPTRDTDLLYAHFDFPRTPEGTFAYWLVLQEIWASGRWIHSRIVASAEEFSRLVARDGWAVQNQPQSFAPCLVVAEEGGLPAELAVLVHGALDHEVIELWRVRIEADQSLAFGDAVAVASGPRGYRM